MVHGKWDDYLLDLGHDPYFFGTHKVIVDDQQLGGIYINGEDMATLDKL